MSHPEGYGHFIRNVDGRAGIVGLLSKANPRAAAAPPLHAMTVGDGDRQITQTPYRVSVKLPHTVLECVRERNQVVIGSCRADRSYTVEQVMEAFSKGMFGDSAGVAMIK